MQERPLLLLRPVVYMVRAELRKQPCQGGNQQRPMTMIGAGEPCQHGADEARVLCVLHQPDDAAVQTERMRVEAFYQPRQGYWRPDKHARKDNAWKILAEQL